MDPLLSDRWLARAHRRDAEAGLRHGAARERVIEVLAREGQCLIGAQELWERMRAGGERTSQASVYRVLDELAALGLLGRTVAPDGTARYELADSGSHHHHFVDDASGEIVPFTDPALEAAIAAAARRLGVTPSAHEVTLRGVRAPQTGG